jgi:hypothetical protein
MHSAAPPCRAPHLRQVRLRGLLEACWLLEACHQDLVADGVACQHVLLHHVLPQAGDAVVPPRSLLVRPSSQHQLVLETVISGPPLPSGQQPPPGGLEGLDHALRGGGGEL